MFLKLLAVQLAGRLDANVVLDGNKIWVTLLNGRSYKVAVEDYEEDDDDPIGDEPLALDYPKPAKITDHMTLLESILHAIVSSELAAMVTGLTSDGDHKDCEAIFKFAGSPVVLKVRRP